MMQVSTSKPGSTTAMTGAVLLYETVEENPGSYAKSKSYSATVHKVQLQGGMPIIQPGRPMSEKDYAALLVNMGKKSNHANRWINPGVLYQASDRFIWWTPPGTRTMFFKTSSHNKHSFEGHATCPVPGLVWMATTKGIYLFAVKGAERPTPETPLQQAPFMNVWASGQICVGNSVRPTDEQFFDASAWEQMFFGSYFTHVNFTQKRRLLDAENATRFWQQMVKKPKAKFPENKLVSINVKANDLIKPDILSTLGGMKATGEF